MNELPEEKIDNSIYSHFVGIKFTNGSRAYFFGMTTNNLVIGDKVVVETARGMELGEVVVDPVEISKYRSPLGLKPILRKATQADVSLYERNIQDAVVAQQICQENVNTLGLDMHLTSTEYTLDKSKVIFSYVSEDRVDFRELLKILAGRLHTRIELRQIGARDKAKIIGGLGTCGLVLCCSTFLNEFDGISVNRAKNQMLAINIPKLSGQCGKLMCCLKYEDDAYTDLKKLFPEVGKEVWIDKVSYRIGAINVISKTLRLDNADGIVFMSLEDFNKQTNNRNFNKPFNKEHNNQNNENDEKQEF